MFETGCLTAVLTQRSLQYGQWVKELFLWRYSYVLNGVSCLLHSRSK
jgi:hypothetical protein